MLIVMALLSTTVVGLPVEAANKKVTFDMKGASVVSVLHFLASAIDMKANVDSCLEGKRTDVHFKAEKLETVLHAVTEDFSADARVEGGVIHVTCRAGTTGKPAIAPDATTSGPIEVKWQDATAVEGAIDELQKTIPSMVKSGAKQISIRDALSKMVEVDQAARKLPDSPDKVAAIGRIDALTTANLKDLLTRYAWFTISEFGPNADKDAWLLVQHADRDPTLQAEVLGRLEKLVQSNETSRSNYAYLFDRVATGAKRPQRFGTQGRCVGPSKWEPFPIEDQLQVDERRAWAGISRFPTLAQYAAVMNEDCKAYEK